AGLGYLLFLVFSYDIVVSVFTKEPAALYIVLSGLYFAALGLRAWELILSRARTASTEALTTAAGNQ
ncbi:MAG: hypothetical protein AAF512_20815, partial [Pseudomonadota bacterium]